MDKLNTMILNSALEITESTTESIEAFSSYQNYLRITAPYDNTSWIPEIIYFPTNVNGNAGVPAEYLLMEYKETTTVDGSTYYVYESDFPPAVTNNSLATQIDVTVVFVARTQDLIGIQRYDEDADGYNDTTYIAAQLLIDFPDAVSGDVVRVFNTDTDWQFNGTAWEDQDDKIVTQIVYHTSDTKTYPIRKGTKTSAPTSAPTNTQLILDALAQKVNTTDLTNDYYTKTALDLLLADKVDQARTIAGIDLVDDITKTEMKIALDIDDAEADIDQAQADIIILDGRIDDYDDANVIKSVTLNPTTFVMTFTYYDDTTSTFDLPIESAVVSIEYDEENKDLIFTLQNGTQTIVPLDDIITGLATETYVTNAIASALVNYYTKSEVYAKTETYSDDEVDALLDEKAPEDANSLELITIADSDVVYVYDISAGSLKKTSISQLSAYINATGLTVERTKAIVAYELEYVADGQYKCNMQTVLETNNLVHFIMPTATETDNLTISINNGLSYLNVKVNDIAITANRASGNLLKLFYNGTELIEYESAGQDSTIPYAGSGTFDESEAGLPVAVKGANVLALNGYTAPSDLEQIVSNGNFADGDTDWSLLNATGSVTDGIYSFTVSVLNGSLYQMLSTKSTLYYIKARYKTDSTSVILSITNNIDKSYIATHTGSGEYEEVTLLADYSTFSASDVSQVRIIDQRSSGWTQIDVEYMLVILLPSTITTVAQAEAIIDGTHFDGLNWAGKPRTYTPSEWTTQMQEYFASVNVASGDTIQGIYIPTQDSDTNAKSVAHIDGELHSIGGVADTLDTQYFGVDENDVLQSATSWGVLFELTNTKVYVKDIQSLLDYKLPPNNSTVVNVFVKIGDTFFTITDPTTQSTNDIENTFSMFTSTTGIGFRVNKTTYPTSADFEAYLQANDVTFIYELDTPLSRTEANNNIIEVDGQLYVEAGGTYSQYGGGVVGQFSTIIPIDIEQQVKANVVTDLKQGQEIAEHEKRLDNLERGIQSAVFAYLTASASTTCTLADTFYPIQGTFTNNIIRDFDSATVNTPGIKYTGEVGKYFEIDFHATLSGNVNNITSEIGIMKNGTIVDGSTMGQYLKILNEQQSASGTCVVYLEKDDEIQLVVNADSAGDIITFGYFTTTIRPF